MFHDPETSKDTRSRIMAKYDKSEDVLDDTKKWIIKVGGITVFIVLVILLSSVFSLIYGTRSTSIINVISILISISSAIISSIMIIRSSISIVFIKSRFYHYYTTGDWLKDDDDLQVVLSMVRMVFTPKPSKYPPIKELMRISTTEIEYVFSPIDIIYGETTDINVEHPLWSDPSVIAHGLNG